MFQCKDLLSLPSLGKAKIISGRSGLNNGIRWVYKPENMNFSRWVKGHELLIISTPVIKSSDFDLSEIIKSAVKLNMSGALMLVGEHYVKQISREIIKYTDDNKFPLFVISGDIPLIDIFEEIGHAIAYNDNADAHSEDVLSSIIFGNEINVEALVFKSEQMGYDITPPQVIFVLHLYLAGEVLIYDRNIIADVIRDSFEKNNTNIVLSHYGNNFVGMFKAFNDMKNVITEVYKDVNDFIRKEYQGVSICIGIGKEYAKLEKLQMSFREATKCITLTDKMNKHSGVYYYRELGFLNLLSELDSTHGVKDFVSDTLGKIIEYDEENNAELLLTLYTYLQNNCSLLHASEQLHMHRNTVKYRIHQIEEITGRTFDDSMTRLEFMNALLCKYLLLN